MVTTFGKGQILKGSDCELVVPVSYCCGSVNIEDVDNFSCAFYTEKDGQAIMKDKDDFVFEGGVGIVHFQAGELDQLEDGLVRYTLQYDNTTLENSTSYWLKTPIGYTPIDFVSRDEMEDAVAEALSSSAGTEVIEEIVSATTSGLASEDYVNSAITQATSGLVDEEYVQNAIKENDWTFVIHSVNSGIQVYNQEEIDAVVRAAKMNPETTPGRAKMVVFYPAGDDGSFLPFYPTNPYRPNEEHEAYLWCVDGYSQELHLNLLGLDEGELPTESNLRKEVYGMYGIVRGQDLKTINGGSIISSSSENLELATPEDIQELWEAINNMPSSSAMTEAIEEATSGLASENYVNSAITQATSGLASENYVNSAITQATSGLASETYVNSAVTQATSGLASETYVNSAVTQATSGLATEQYVQSAITSSNLVYAMTNTNKIWAGPRAAYSAQTIDNTVLYFITD